MSSKLTTLEKNLSSIRNIGVSPVTQLLWDHGRSYITEYARSLCQRNSQILDVGCGRAGYLISLAGEKCKSYGIDPLLEVSLKPAKNIIDEQGLAIQLLCALGENIPFRDETFDIALLTSTLQHVSNQDNVLLEIRRVLKPGGRLLVSVPQRKGIYSVRCFAANALLKIRSQENVYTMDFSYGDFKKVLTKNGFSVIKIHGYKFLPIMLPGLLSLLLKAQKRDAVMKIIEFSDKIADRINFTASVLIALCEKEKAR